MTSQLQATWEPDPYQPFAKRYHEACDKYNLQVCEHPSGIPRTPQERQLVSRNAKEVFARLVEDCCFTLKQPCSVVEPQLLKAIRYYAAR